MSFIAKLTDLLKTDPRFVDEDGELILAAVQDRAWKLDRDLVKLLLSEEEIKAMFFDEIEGDALDERKGHWIFNFNTFLDYISQKNFLANSYTRFRNRIGLTIGGKFLRERGEVALAWPYKDCVLEGGQTKEEEKRQELFFNEILAQDEINRLLDPKALTNFARYTAEGKEEVRDFKRDENGVIRENLIVKGNNLLALHTLKTQFRGQVKLIYIDPPYNTGNDTFGYNDSFNHSTWLTFMKNRLEIAKELLSKDGSIWINIDDDEAHYLKVLCDSVFGRDNFVRNIIWQKKYAAANDAKGIPDVHDHILIYRRSGDFSRNLLPRTEKQNVLYKHDDGDGKGPWRTDNLLVKTFSQEYVFSITNPNTGKIYHPREGSCWRTNKETVGRWIQEGRIFFGKDGKGAPQLKRYLHEVQGGIVPVSWWDFKEAGHNDEAKKEIQKLSLLQDDGLNFSTPKPERLLQRIILIGSVEGDIVLDFQLGSGTTAAVAHKMNRQYVGVEQMDYIEKIPVERLKKVINGEQSGISASVHWQGGGDFIYCELMKYNEVFMERIQAAQSSEELVQIWREMAESSFLNWYVNPAMPEEAVRDFEELGKAENGPSAGSGQGLEKQKRLLAELLDKNQLYVNLSEIDDAMFEVKAEDKALNRAFYGEAL